MHKDHDRGDFGDRFGEARLGGDGGLLDGPLMAIAVGNSRTRLGLFLKGELSSAASVSNTEGGGSSGVTAIVNEVERLTGDHHDVPVVIASVNDPVADKVAAKLEETGDVYRVGPKRDIPVPLHHALDDASTLGMDRQLCALAAYSRAQQACVIIDAGTAITVDFVDGEGTFQGGVIAPGLSMMLASLHEKTAALPKLQYANPDPARGPFGKDTKHAMILGVRGAAIGLARYVIEQFAEKYEAYPQIVATGGDAATLFENDEIVEAIVPDLQLIGILNACKAAMEGADEE